jgi:hypothetical protein
MPAPISRIAARGPTAETRPPAESERECPCSERILHTEHSPGEPIRHGGLNDEPLVDEHYAVAEAGRREGDERSREYGCKSDREIGDSH